jgi:hypothetical protein
MRDVYPWNFLNEGHLKQKVENITLRKWIKAAPDRGTIEKNWGELTLWSLDPEQTPNVRRRLNAAGLLVAPNEWELSR